MLKSLFIALTFLAFFQLSAQDSRLASQYYMDGEFEKAADLFGRLYDKFPSNTYYFEKYVECLNKTEQTQQAENVVKMAYKRAPEDIAIVLAYGELLEKSGRDKEADKIYTTLLDKKFNNINEVNYLGSRLKSYNKLDLAVSVYKRGLAQFQYHPDLSYSAAIIFREAQLSKEMVTAYLDALLGSQSRLTIVQSHIQRYFAEADFVYLKEQLYDRVQKDPSTLAYTELLAWVLMQEKNIAGALRQYMALDRRLQLDGSEVFEMGKIAVNEREYKVALQAFQYLIDNKARNQGVYFKARQEWLEVSKRKIAESAGLSPLEEREALSKAYFSFLSDFGINSNTARVLASYADYEGMVNDRVDKGIELYRQLLAVAGLNKYLLANAKINLGDLYLVKGEIWEATLLYAQIDKEFKDEIIGQEARYRMAKMSYYNGDFEWAKQQFDILKVSTSRMISNDAIDRVVFINDNLNLDTNALALTLFAKAELLIERRQYQEGLDSLQVIFELFPEHGLVDDIYYLKANIAQRQRKYSEAERYYRMLIEKYAEDIKADDALFELAELYEHKMGESALALALYEKIFMEYESSIFAVEARKRYRQLKGGVPAS
jgi:tetratricopeptide (TPR) repeat protein